MKSKHLIILACVVIILGIIYAVQRKDSGNTAPSGSRELVPASFSSDGLADIKFKGKDGAVTLKQTPSGWVVAERHDYPADTDGPVRKERCLYKRNGSCGLCVRRCPIHALTLESGFDRVACQRHLADFEKRLGADVCGKCTLQLPCTYRIPNRDGV